MHVVVVAGEWSHQRVCWLLPSPAYTVRSMSFVTRIPFTGMFS
jgi:hypothetical protein